jgi:hypothetical protein
MVSTLIIINRALIAIRSCRMPGTVRLGKSRKVVDGHDACTLRITGKAFNHILLERPSTAPKSIETTSVVSQKFFA